MVTYLIIFLLCIFIDQLKGEKFNLLKKTFLFFIYFFFCFGYTIGTDWRFYEDLYLTSTENYLLNRNIEQGFYYLIYLIREIIPDFWLFLGLIKCLYLYAFIRVIKIFTNEIFTIIAIMFSYNLLFMLIDNPLRFMSGAIILLLATPYLIKKKYIKYLCIAGLSLLFHISLLVPVILSLLIVFKDKLIKNNKKLFIIYTFSFIFSMLPAFILSINEYFAIFLPSISNKLLDYYFIDRIGGNFTLGSLLHFLLFILFMVNKNIFSSFKYGEFIFFMSFIYFIIFRAFINLPTGFRLSIYFSLFFGIGLFYIFKKGKLKFKLIVLFIIGFIFAKNLYSSYQFIPYTNSVYYIITGEHKSFQYRDKLNKIEYKKRTGNFPNENKDVLKD